MLQEKDYDILHGDSASVLKSLPDECVDMCVTSPPYWAIRDYHSGDDEIGREETPLEYVAKLRDVFHEVKRVLKSTGTLWLNLGDTYNGSKKGNTEVRKNPALAATQGGLNKKEWKELPSKSLIGIPWRVAFALQDDGWILRNDIIWHRCNSLPESAPDRLSRAHEYIFLFSKSPRGYYFDNDAIKEPAAGNDGTAIPYEEQPGDSLFELPASEDKACTCESISSKEQQRHYKNLRADEKGQPNHSFHKSRAEGKPDAKYQMCRKRDVWNIPTHGFSGAHFATFPEKLVEPCILAGCSQGGIVMDVFNGAGTTGVVALKNGRRYLGIELNAEYIKLSHERIAKETAQQTFEF